MFFPCIDCAKEFRNIEDLNIHRHKFNHMVSQERSELKALEKYLKAYHQTKIVITKTDREKSKQVVKEVLQNIKTRFRENGLYSKIESAGSNASQTKVYKADEFDFNIYINVNMNDLRLFKEGNSVVYAVEKRDVSF